VKKKKMKNDKNIRKGITAILFAAMMLVSVFAVPIVQADINPSSVTLDMSPGESQTISKTITVPDYPPKLDLYLLEDETSGR
jgi:hypothetical protein